MRTAREIFSQKSLVTIFVYLPVGLGHLRVTEALYHGLPEESTTVLLGAQGSSSLAFLYRMLSIHPLLRSAMELFQKGFFEDIFTYFYRTELRSKGKELYKQLETILDEQIELPKNLLMIAPHYAYAYQLVAIKKKFAKEKGVRVTIVVQVTDDCPIDLWYVEGADIIFVPSYKTAEVLAKYGRDSHLWPVKFEVNAYPISPRLSKHISQELFHMRVQQLDDSRRTNIHMAIPISGAAVGTQFFTTLIDTLYDTSDRFVFHVIVKSAPYTQTFLRQMLARPHVKLTVSLHDRGIVEEYERLYENELISLEVTKPSEQSFKALLSPLQRGGPIMLFSLPVGRQEYDNLDFLRRNNLIPHQGERNYLWDQAVKNGSLEGESDKKVMAHAIHWRGIELPADPVEAANFIRWCMRVGIFSKMVHYEVPKFDDPRHAVEINSEGVKRFWEKVGNFIDNNL